MFFYLNLYQYGVDSPYISAPPLTLYSLIYQELPNSDG